MRKRIQTKFHFNLKKMRPALCGYCRIPAGPFLRIGEDTIYGACSKEHLELLREDNKLKTIAVVCDEGIDYAITKSKDTYLNIAKSRGTFVMHEWERKDRELFLGRVVNAYMTWANEQARTGRMDKVVRDGSD